MVQNISCLRVLGWGSLIVVGLLVIAGLFLFWPVNPAPLGSKSKPAADYDEAIQRVQALQVQEKSGFNPLCQTQLLTHGQKVQQVVVLVHGYTTCPNQYRALAPRLYDLGYNVLMVPMPHHGLAERMTEEQSRLTAEELVAYADQMVDIAQGLGEQVTMAGISGGGVTTAWAAQHRSDLDRAIIISPAFGYAAIPTPLTVPALRAYLWLPNSYQWWDTARQEAGGQPYAYPRYATRTLAELLRLGLAVMADARREPPAAGSVVVVSNASEPSVNNAMIEKATALWQAHAPEKVKAYQFPSELNLPHDLIDPGDPGANPEVVYTKLIELIQAP